MRVLLTGGYGCIGAWIVRNLFERGADVFIYDLKEDPRRLRLILPDEQARLRGARVFGRACARCHSSKRPLPGKDEKQQEEFFRWSPTAPLFLEDNFLSEDERRTRLCADAAGTAAERFFALPTDPAARIEAQAAFIWSQACTGKFVWPIPDKGLKKRIHRVAV